MIVVNTTFHVDCRIYHDVVTWLGATYVPASLEGGSMSHPRLMRILGGTDPEAIGIACQTQCASLADAKRWITGAGAVLLHQGADRWGNRFAWFTTYLEPLELENLEDKA